MTNEQRKKCQDIKTRFCIHCLWFKEFFFASMSDDQRIKDNFFANEN